MNNGSFSPRPVPRSVSGARILALGTVLFLSGCNFSPAYKQPDPHVQNAWPKNTFTPTVQSARSVADLGWEEFFTDPRLKKLIEIALTSNRDLASQFAAIVEARGQYETQNSALFPNISVGAGAMYQAPSDNAGFSFAPGSDAAKNGKQAISLLHFYQTSIGFSSYEIDLWGRIRNLSIAQKEETLSSYENLRNLWITTISQVGSVYIQWLADRNMLDIARQRVASQEKTLHLTTLTFQNGEENALTVAQIQSQLDQARTDVAQQERAMAQDEHALQLLIGQPLPDDLPPPAPMGDQTMLADLPAGLPSDLLQQRPDIQSAEHQLMSANANIGAARAAFYPRFTLTASEGISSLQFHRLFTNLSETWGLSPSVSIPIFTWGQNSGNLRTAKARAAAAVANYQKAVQSAFREVSDALTARETYKIADMRLANVVKQSQTAYSLAYMRFKEGIDNYLTTLVQERQLYQAQQFHVYVQASRFQNMVTLYRALGGGWVRKEPSTAAPDGRSGQGTQVTNVAEGNMTAQSRVQTAQDRSSQARQPSVAQTLAATDRDAAPPAQVQKAAQRAATIHGPVPDSWN